ncbi:MAG: filamentous hemagglutinin N-terminal domain-containing protein [Spirulinaceae cyanobacterium]
MKFPLFALCLALTGFALPAEAQITPDQTLGAENSTVQITSPGQVQINGGAIRGANLFHSFEQFSILESQAAYFSNPSGIANIFSRVTGSDPSHIFGTLGVLGDANLFLLNPNGVIFGPNARLDLTGAFTASTAESFILPGGEAFSAVNPNGAPLLTVDVPLNVGLRFGSGATGAVVNEGSLNSGANLNLIGRSVVNTGVLKGKNVELLGVAEAIAQVDLGADGSLTGVVQDESVGEIAVTGLPETLPSEIGAVAATPGSTVVSGTVEGVEAVQVWGDRVALTNADIKAKNIQAGGDYRGEGSVLNASRTVVDEGSSLTGERVIVWAEDLTLMAGQITAPGGFVEVSGREQLVFRGQVEADTLLLDPRNITISSAPSTAGVGAALPDIFASDFAATDITINAADLESQSGTIILEATNDIILADSLDFVSGGDITWIADSDGDGIGTIIGTAERIHTNGRDIKLVAAEMEGLEIFTEGGEIFMQSTHGDIVGREIETEDPFGANNIEIRSAGNIDLEQIDASSFFGDGGEVDIFAEGDVRVRRDIKTDALFGGGNDITVTANGDIELNGEIISFGEDSNGDIKITSNNSSVTIERASLISGDVALEQDVIDFIVQNTIPTPNIDSSINSIKNLESNDDAGSIEINAVDSINLNEVAILNYGSRSAETTNGEIKFQGTSGNFVDVNLDTVFINNETYSGDAKNIIFDSVNNLNASNTHIILEMHRRADSSDSSSPDIIVNAIGLIYLSDGSYLSNENRSPQPTGNIIIAAKDLKVENSLISASTDSISTSGTGGLVQLIVHDDVIVSGRTVDESIPDFAAIASISLSPAQAGDIEIFASNVTIMNGAAISALAATDDGYAGNVTIQASEAITVSDNSLISVDTRSTEDSGNIKLTANRLAVAGDSAVTASAFDIGDGGNVTVVSDQITVDDRSQIATISNNSGDAGNVILITQNLDVSNNSALSVSSDPLSEEAQVAIVRTNALAEAAVLFTEGTILAVTPLATGNGGGNAGTLNINTNQIRLSNQSQIVGESSSGNGGNLNINAQDLVLLRFNSSISTTAGTAQAGGNGGNITINAPFIIGVPTENSDITANAFSGSGGNININAVAIYGLGFRPFLTPLSDITASSQLGVQGTVILNLTGADLSQSLTALPSEPVNTEVAQGCQAIGRGATVDLLVIGNSHELIQNGSINTDGITARWLSLDLIEAAPANPTTEAPQPEPEIIAVQIHNCNG